MVTGSGLGWAGPVTFNDTFVGAAGFKVEVFPIRFVLRAWKAGILAVTLELTRNPRMKPIQMQTEWRGRKNQVLVTLLGC